MNQRQSPDVTISTIPMETNEGRQLLAESNFNRVEPYSAKQKHLKYCGLCSIAVCLNELLASQANKTTVLLEKMREIGLARKEFTPKIDENHVLALVEANNVVDKHLIDNQGLTLQEFVDVVESLKLKYFVGYAVKKELIAGATSKISVKLSSVDDFRDILLQLLSSGYHVVINFDLSCLGYPKLKGHFSPLGGIHEIDDRVLILDTWPSVPMSWVKIKDLYNAMATVDKTSGKPRGICAFKV